MLIKENLNQKVCSPGDVADLLHGILRLESRFDREKEHLWTIGLDTQNKIKFIELVSLGILTFTPAHPREIFRTAIIKGVCSIIIGHNHPSGELKPSKEDIKVYKNLRKAGRLLGIPVLDSIIINGKGRHARLNKR